ncbi:hypothetical protein ACN47E_004317 [Coniothyrium glycines]
MLVNSRAWIAYGFVALGTVYAAFLLFNIVTLQKFTSPEWPHVGSDAASPGKIASDSLNNVPDIVNPSKTSSFGTSLSLPTDLLSPTSKPAVNSIASALNTPPSILPTLAIATFLTGQATDDLYYNSTRLLVYQLLHAPETRIKNPALTFVVLCGNKLPEHKKQQLRSDGATVIPLDDVQLPDWIHTNEARWSEQFTKLRVFELEQYKRILYIDADYLIMHPLDDIFEDPIVTSLTPTLFTRENEIQEDEGPLPKEWLFAARCENGAQGGFDHFVPPLQNNYANAGFFLIAPDRAMYDYLIAVMHIKGRFSTQYMEQDMLNYIFRRNGPMPWRELNWKWSANFVNDRDVQNGVHSLHGKFWKEGPKIVQERWKQLMQQRMDWETKRQ